MPERLRAGHVRYILVAATAVLLIALAFTGAMGPDIIPAAALFVCLLTAVSQSEYLTEDKPVPEGTSPDKSRAPPAVS